MLVASTKYQKCNPTKRNSNVRQKDSERETPGENSKNQSNCFRRHVRSPHPWVWKKVKTLRWFIGWNKAATKMSLVKIKLQREVQPWNWASSIKLKFPALKLPILDDIHFLKNKIHKIDGWPLPKATITRQNVWKERELVSDQNFQLERFSEWWSKSVIGPFGKPEIKSTNAHGKNRMHPTTENSSGKPQDNTRRNCARHQSFLWRCCWLCLIWRLIPN